VLYWVQQGATGVNHEIWRGNQLIETILWEGAPCRFGHEEDENRREALRLRAIDRAIELRALAFERRNPNWLESVHLSFACREVNEGREVEITTPLGVCRLKANRRKGQQSLPVELHGRLNPPEHATGWTFQPSCFVYADGTRSDWLGSYPRDITWDIAPEWPV